jgi:hypothetical protein
MSHTRSGANGGANGVRFEWHLLKLWRARCRAFSLPSKGRASKRRRGQRASLLPRIAYVSASRVRFTYDRLPDRQPMAGPSQPGGERDRGRLGLALTGGDRPKAARRRPWLRPAKDRLCARGGVTRCAAWIDGHPTGALPVPSAQPRTLPVMSIPDQLRAAPTAELTRHLCRQTGPIRHVQDGRTA